MKNMKALWFAFLNKEKIVILSIIFILINISIFVVFKGSITSQSGYIDQYPNAGLEFYYSLFCVGINPFLFMLMMLLIPNIISYDFLNYQQSHASYFIETRITKKKYYIDAFIKNIILSFLMSLIMFVIIAFIIHFFYAPILFNTTIYPELYYAKTQILFSHEILNLIVFIILSALGYALISSLIFSLQVLISNKYIYRCFGVIFGILLVLIPALIQGYLPSPDLAFVFQINNIVALGMENVRANPFGLSHIALYSLCFILYSFISYGCYQGLLKWRQYYD